MEMSIRDRFASTSSLAFSQVQRPELDVLDRLLVVLALARHRLIEERVEEFLLQELKMLKLSQGLKKEPTPADDGVGAETEDFSLGSEVAMSEIEKQQRQFDPHFAAVAMGQGDARLGLHHRGIEENEVGILAFRRA